MRDPDPVENFRSKKKAPGSNQDRICQPAVLYIVNIFTIVLNSLVDPNTVNLDPDPAGLGSRVMLSV